MEMNKCITSLSAVWDSSPNSLVSESNQIINLIAADSSLKPWLSELLLEKESVELYRDRNHGFVLTAYTEKFGQYRPPHNHGKGWVIYSVISGGMEMGSYDQNIFLLKSENF